MSYDVEKYRYKRLKVLGIKRQGISFGMLALAVSLVILSVLAWLIVPGTLDWWNERHLIDAIYRMKDGRQWAPAVVPSLRSIQGITDAHRDKDGTRLTVTFDKTKTDTAAIASHFQERDINAVLLNAVPRRHRLMESMGG